MRLNHLLEALSNDSEDEEAGESGQGGGGGQGGGSGGDQPLHDIAELKLLKLMQEDVNGRTRALEDQLVRAKTLTNLQQREYQQLSQEQGQLADLVLGLQAGEAADDQDNPENLPDVRDDLDVDVDLPIFDIDGDD